MALQVHGGAPPAPGFGLDRSQFYRIYKIDRMIAQGAYPNVPKLAAFFEVSRRTIERDLAYMRDMLNAPLIYDRKKGGYRYEHADFRLPAFTLTEGELVALFIGQKLLRQYSGTPFEKQIGQAFAKICCLLPEKVSVDLSFFDQAFSFGLAPPRGDELAVLKTYQALAGAMQACRSIRMVYYTASRGVSGTRLVDPYHLHYRDGAWYLVGYCHLRREIRMFAVDRIRELEVTGRTFTPDPAFDIGDYLKESLVLERGGELEEVVVRFDPFQARYIRERVWHPSQETEEAPDGSLILRFKVRGLGEVQRWVLSFGCRAEVLAPPALRQAVQEEARRLANLYDGAD
ncbi:MAG: WYL domain-containing protein [Bacillota bacterium]